MPAYGNVPVKVAGAWASSIPSVKVAGVWTQVTQGWAKVAGVWQQFYSSVLSFSSSPSSISASRTGAGSLTSSAVSYAVAGGIAPYTQLWSYVSGNSFTINTATALTTTFTTNFPTAGAFRSGTYRLTVTDNVGAVLTADFTVDMESF